MAVHDVAVHLQGAGAALAEARIIVFPIEHKRVLARCKRLFALPLDAFQLDHVPGESRDALEQIEAVTGEPATVGHQHAFSATLWDLDLGGDRVGAIEQARRRAGIRERHIVGVNKVFAVHNPLLWGEGHSCASDGTRFES